ncbi:hypothetical protein QL285_080921 [Trifolium repens]|nr:hypothetical protein QL285_080921 [Trifolium repens]
MIRMLNIVCGYVLVLLVHGPKYFGIQNRLIRIKQENLSHARNRPKKWLGTDLKRLFSTSVGRQVNWSKDQEGADDRSWTWIIGSEDFSLHLALVYYVYLRISCYFRYGATGVRCVTPVNGTKYLDVENGLRPIMGVEPRREQAHAAASVAGCCYCLLQSCSLFSHFNHGEQPQALFHDLIILPF